MARNTYSQDETLERKFDLSKLKRALVYLKPHKAKLVTAVLLSSLSSILSLLPPYMLSKAIDNAIPDENVNRSGIHVDFVVGSDDLNIYAILQNGNEIQIMKNGEWLMKQ